MKAIFIALFVIYLAVTVAQNHSFESAPVVKYTVPEQGTTPTTAAVPTKDCIESEGKFQDHWNKWSDKLTKKYGKVITPEESNLLDGLVLTKGERKDINKILVEGRKLVTDCGEYLDTSPEVLTELLDATDMRVNGIPG